MPNPNTLTIAASWSTIVQVLKASLDRWRTRTGGSTTDSTALAAPLTMLAAEFLTNRRNWLIRDDGSDPATTVGRVRPEFRSSRRCRPEVGHRLGSRRPKVA